MLGDNIFTKVEGKNPYNGGKCSLALPFQSTSLQFTALGYLLSWDHWKGWNESVYQAG